MRDRLVAEAEQPYRIDTARQKGEQKGSNFYPGWKTRQQENPHAYLW